MKFDVLILPAAEHDIDQILSWLIAASLPGAASWLSKWDDMVESLKQSAGGCGFAPENDDHDLPIQQVIFKTKRGTRYRAIFTIRNATVHILHVRGPGQNLMAGEDIALPD